MGNTPPNSASGPAAVSGNTYERTSVDNRNSVTRPGPAPNTVTPPAPTSNGVTNPVRCPRCRRLLQPPAGHARFLCPCGQMLMAPAATELVHVRCPRCQTTLAPPPGASVFRCPCGVALRAPLQRGGSARAVNDVTPSGTGAGGASGPVVPGGGKFEDENLLPDEIIANTVRKPNEEHWILNSGRDDKLYWVRLMSEEQQAHIQKLIKETADNMKANLDKLSVREMKEKLEGMGIDTADALDKGDLSSMLLNSLETVNGKSVEEIKSLLDSHSTDYTFCLVKEELSELLVAVGWYGEAHFSDGFVRKFVGEFDLEVIPAQKYALDPEFAKYKISPTEIERMSSRPFREKVRWFRDQCKKNQIKWEDGRVQIKIRRTELLRDSFNNFNRLKPIDLRRYLRFEFLGEEGVDAGGVAREWFELVTDSCFNVDCGLFEYSGVDNICYQINPASGIANDLHEQYFHFLGRVVGKALFDHKFIRAHVTQPIYKHILGYPITMKDIEFCDAHLYQSLQEMQEAPDVSDYLLTFTTMLEVFGENQEIELKPGGGEIALNNNNLQEYIHLMTKYVMFERTKSQLAHFLQGLYDVIPPIWLAIFDYRELELLLCGLPNINVNDWKKNTKYRGVYAAKGQTHKVVQWFWEVVEESSQEQRALILQFCTGTSRVPVQGFEALQGNDGNIKPFTIDSAKLSDIVYPKAHTCFNRIELPMYRTKEELVRRFEEALSQGTTGFSDE